MKASCFHRNLAEPRFLAKFCSNCAKIGLKASIQCKTLKWTVSMGGFLTRAEQLQLTWRPTLSPGEECLLLITDPSSSVPLQKPPSNIPPPDHQPPTSRHVSWDWKCYKPSSTFKPLQLLRIIANRLTHILMSGGSNLWPCLNARFH